MEGHTGIWPVANVRGWLQLTDHPCTWIPSQESACQREL